MRTLILGRLRAKREGLAFVPEPDRDFTAERGEEIEIAVLYEYEEPTLAQDHFEATLSLDVTDADPVHETKTIQDVPFNRERVTGVLARRLTIQGPIEGHYELRAALASRPWSIQPAVPNRERVLETGAFRVRVQ